MTLFSVELLSDLLSHSVEEIEQDASLKVRLLAFYRYAFAEQPCGNCKDKIQGYYIKLKSNGMERVSKKIERVFELKEGVCIPVKFGSAEMFSNANLTDEAAIRILANNKNRKVVFKVLPKDWEEKVDAYVESQKEAADEAEVSEVIKHMSSNTAKDLIKEIKETDDSELLNSMLLAEEGGNNRDTVVKAIEAQIEALNPVSPEE